MLISDAYSWGPKHILEVVVIPYYGYICSDDDNPDGYVFNPYPYGVVDLDAYYGGNLPDEDLKTIIVVEYYYGRNGKTRSNDNPEGVVGLIYIDAYIAGIEYFSQNIIACEYIDGNVYNHSDYNSLGVVIIIDAYFTNIDDFSNNYLVCFCDEGRIGNNGFDSSRNYGIFGVVY